MTNLEDKKCVPCKGGTPTLSPEHIREYMGKVDGWVERDHIIEKNLTLKNFEEALAFVNKVGKVAEEEGHHPDICIYDYKKVKISLTTHAVGGLTDNDFIMASKIDHLL